MTTIRQQTSTLLPFAPRLPATPPPVAPRGLGTIGGALKDLFGDTHSSYSAQLRGKDDKALGAEGLRLQKVIADASSGGDKNPGAVSRAKAQLSEVKEEQATRATIAKSADPAWGKKAHSMNDAQLGTERARQLERYQEATTGVDRDPAKAADAKSKLDFLNKESFSRVVDRFQGALPKASITKPTGLIERVTDLVKYGNMSPAQLSGEKAKLTKTLRDATSGPHQDVQLAANTQQKLELINHCQQRGSKPVNDADLKKYEKGLDHCSSGELHHRRQTCRKEENACREKGDPVGAANCRRKAEVCEGAIVRHREELTDCKRRVGGMTDRQLGDFGSRLDGEIKKPENAHRRGELCEQAQICRHEQHERLCKREFPGTEPTPGVERPGDQQRTVEDLIKSLLQGAERYQEATTGVDQSPKAARTALQDIERDLKQLLEQLVKLFGGQE